MGIRHLYLARHGEAIDDGELSATGRQQATALGRRLAGLPLAGIHHGPLPRAVQTARLISAALPGVPLHACEAVGDYVPPVPDPRALPEVYARFLADVTPADYARGSRLAAAATARFAVPTVAGDTHELVVTHNFLIGWFIRHALDAPPWRWIGLDLANCSLTTIVYRADRPPTLVGVNDTAHTTLGLRK
jgi:serine/threonine-protein phosphatase PGAM5